MSINLLVILASAALIVFLILRRFRGQPVRARSYVLPSAISLWGLTQLRGVHLGAADLVFLAVSVVLAVGVGLARGMTTHLYVRDGSLWERYGLATLAVWVGTVLLRIGCVAAARPTGVQVATRSLVLVLGISLAAEAAVIAWRAARTGVPAAPSRGMRPVER